MECKKIQGGNPLHETYILGTQEKTDPRITDRFLLSHGKLSGFRVCGTAWTFSCTVSVDLPLDHSPIEDLVEITRSKFKEVEGASERPGAIEYLSAIYRCWSSFHLWRHKTFLYTDFSKLPTQPGIPCGNAGFLTLLGVLC